MSTSESFGMMSEAYFVGRYELIQWINSFLKLNIRKVEECATGAIHCQIFDALYPGKMPMSKVNFEAKHEYEFVKNFKLLQNLFVSVGINKIFPVERIVKARYQDNLELLQWVYEYFNRNFSGQEYDPIKRRSKSKGAKAAGRAAPAAPGRNVTKGGKENARIESRVRPGATAARTRTKRGESAVPSVPAELLEKSELQVQELGVVVRDLEKERDFYFSKILQVETLCKERETSENIEPEFIQSILDVLYATEHDAPAVEYNDEHNLESEEINAVRDEVLI